MADFLAWCIFLGVVAKVVLPAAVAVKAFSKDEDSERCTEEELQECIRYMQTHGFPEFRDRRNEPD